MSRIAGIITRRAFIVATALILVVSSISLTQVFAATSSTETVPDFVERSWHVDGMSGGIAADNQGNVYMPRGGSEIIMYSGSTASTTSPTEPTILKTWTGFGALGDIAVDDDGYIYVTSGNNVLMFNSSEPSGAPSVTVWTGFASSWGIDVDSDGDIVVANNSGGTYRLFNRSEPAGAVTTKVWTGVNDAWTVAFDDDGNVYAGGWAAANIKKFHKSEDAGTPENIVTWNGINGTWLNGVHWAEGYVYTASNVLGDSGTIERFPDDAPDGNIGSVKEFIGAGSAPYSIGSDGNGAIYGALYSNSVIAKYVIPQNLAELTVPNSSDEILVELPSNNHIIGHSTEEMTLEDEGFEYPLGLVNFTFMTSNDDDKEVNIYIQTELEADEVTPRKFNATTETYSDIPGAIVTETSYGGQSALLLTYEISDGGPLDEDGEVNGVIVDPVGLAVLAATDDGDGDGDGGESGGGTTSEADGESGENAGAFNGVGVPNTGLAPRDVMIFLVLGIIGGGLLAGLRLVSLRRKTQIRNY